MPSLNVCLHGCCHPINCSTQGNKLIKALQYSSSCFIVTSSQFFCIFSQAMNWQQNALPQYPQSDCGGGNGDAHTDQRKQYPSIKCLTGCENLVAGSLVHQLHEILDGG
jgi:hypothetical protein